jgi:hypothetical protein
MIFTKKEGVVKMINMLLSLNKNERKQVCTGVFMGLYVIVASWLMLVVMG